MSDESKYMLLLILAAILAIIAIFYVGIRDQAWEKYKKDHHCVLVEEQRRSAVPSIPNREIWNCDGAILER